MKSEYEKRHSLECLFESVDGEDNKMTDSFIYTHKAGKSIKRIYSL